MGKEHKNLAKEVLKNTKQAFFKVNLLIHKEEQSKLYLRLLKWLLYSGRFIVVFVELLTIGAFVYRYKLDFDLIDLQEKIKEEVPYVKSLKQDEILIRQTQFQLSTIKQVKRESPNFTATLLKIAQLTPKSIILTNITLDRGQTPTKTALIISGQTPSNIELGAFIKALQKDSAFSGITLTNISFEGQTNFTITGSLNEKGVQQS